MRHTIVKLSFIPLLSGIVSLMAAENERDFRYGQTSAQSTESLPKSSAVPQQAFRLSKKPVNTIIPKLNNNVWELKGGWELSECDNIFGQNGALFSDTFNTKNWLNAKVPGTVLTSLVESGIYPDPYYGLNNLAIPDSLCRKEWCYRISFQRPQSLSMKKAWLLLEGINYKADIWMNSSKLGNIYGAFSRGCFDVTDVIKDNNVVAVKIYPPNNPGIPHEQSMTAGQGHNGGVLCLDGPTFICSEGWDWIPGIRDRNIGIWQPVKLKYTGNVALGDTQVISDLPLPDTKYADLTIKSTLHNTSNTTKEPRLSIKLDGEELLSTNVSLLPYENKDLSLSPTDFENLRIKKPRLWWPNGYGPQELYNLSLEIYDGNDLSDISEVRFGIREYSYILSADDSEGNELRLEYFPTNDIVKEYPFDPSYRRSAGDGGVTVPKLKDNFKHLMKRIVAKDKCAPYLVICCNGKRIFCRGGNWGMEDGLKRATRERLEPALRFHREQGFNIIRNWTGETTEEVFYSLCDEYGMMVWNDFWISTEGANLDVTDENLFMKNATETVRRFRNHPSIAIWCPRNEGYAPQSLDCRLSEMIAKEDGTRHYNPNSRYMNLRTSGPWHYLKDQTEYLRHHAQGFSTELGSPSVPTAESMKKFIPDSEQWPISDTWCYHDLHSGLPHYCNSIDSLYGKSDSMEEFCNKAQMINYDSYRNMFEAWNSNMWDSTSGVLLWMSHPAWPSVEWQTYSWDLETPGAYFGSKKACEQLHIQMNRCDNKIEIINIGKKIQEGTVVVSQFDVKGKMIYQESVSAKDIQSNTKTNVPLRFDKQKEARLVRLQLFEDNRCVSLNDYWVENNGDFKYLNNLGIPEIELTDIKYISEGGKSFIIKNISEIPAVAVKFNLRDSADGSAILPSYFSEGYINLMPGESRNIKIESNFPPNIILSAEGYNLPLTILSNI